MDIALAQLYGALLVAGIVLITLEVFLPGGIVGSIGAIALVAAAGVALWAFPGFIGVLASAGAVLFTVTAIVLWLKVFPHTRIGRALTVATDLQTAHGETKALETLVGQTGQTVNTLRPAGFATIGGRRIDVVTYGEALPAGCPVRVVLVEGNRVVVEAVAEPKA